MAIPLAGAGVANAQETPEDPFAPLTTTQDAAPTSNVTAGLSPDGVILAPVCVVLDPTAMSDGVSPEALMGMLQTLLFTSGVDVVEPPCTNETEFSVVQAGETLLIAASGDGYNASEFVPSADAIPAALARIATQITTAQREASVSIAIETIAEQSPSETELTATTEIEPNVPAPATEDGPQTDSQNDVVEADDRRLEIWPFFVLNISALTGQGYYSGPRIAPSFGVAGRGRLNSGTELQGEVFFDPRGAAYTYFISAYDLALDYLSVAMLARFPLRMRRDGRQHHVSVGVQPSVLLSARSQQTILFFPYPIYSYSYAGVNRFDMSAAIGIQFALRARRRNPDANRELELRFTQGVVAPIPGQGGSATLSMRFRFR